MEVIKLLKACLFNLNGFGFTDYFRVLLFSLPFVWSKVLGVVLQIIITAGDLLTKLNCSAHIIMFPDLEILLHL